MGETAPRDDSPDESPEEGSDPRSQHRHKHADRLAAALRAAAVGSAPLTPAAADRGSPTRSLTSSPDLPDLADRLCSAAVRSLNVQGVTLCALFAPGMSVPVGVSDPTAARAEELQFSAGEGPCWLAYATSEVVVADFTDPGEVARLDRLWPAYAPALRRQTGYCSVVGLPLVLASGLHLVFTVYASSGIRDRWWQAAAVVIDALREALEAASPPMAQGGPVWLDSSSTLRRGAVWVAESLLVEEDPLLDPVRALRALRTFAVIRGMTVDAAAAALVGGNLSPVEVLGRD